MTDSAGDIICNLPLPGWHCTRVPGHDGPCAVHPTEWTGPLTDNEEATIETAWQKHRNTPATPASGVDLGALEQSAFIAVRDVSSYVEVGESEDERCERVEAWASARNTVCQTALALTAELRASRAEVEAKNAEIAQLLELAHDMLLDLEGTRIFLTTREKMHECGVQMRDEIVSRARIALALAG